MAEQNQMLGGAQYKRLKIGFIMRFHMAQGPHGKHLQIKQQKHCRNNYSGSNIPFTPPGQPFLTLDHE